LHSARIRCEKALFRDAFWRALFGATTTTTTTRDDDATTLVVVISIH